MNDRKSKMKRFVRFKGKKKKFSMDKESSKKFASFSNATSFDDENIVSSKDIKKNSVIKQRRDFVKKTLIKDIKKRKDGISDSIKDIPYKALEREKDINVDFSFASKLSDDDNDKKAIDYSSSFSSKAISVFTNTSKSMTKQPLRTRKLNKKIDNINKAKTKALNNKAKLSKKAAIRRKQAQIAYAKTKRRIVEKKLSKASLSLAKGSWFSLLSGIFSAGAIMSTITSFALSFLGVVFSIVSVVSMLATILIVSLVTIIGAIASLPEEIGFGYMEYRYSENPREIMNIIESQYRFDIYNYAQVLGANGIVNFETSSVDWEEVWAYYLACDVVGHSLLACQVAETSDVSTLTDFLYIIGSTFNLHIADWDNVDNEGVHWSIIGGTNAVGLYNAFFMLYYDCEMDANGEYVYDSSTGFVKILNPKVEYLGDTTHELSLEGEYIPLREVVSFTSLDSVPYTQIFNNYQNQYGNLFRSFGDSYALDTGTRTLRDILLDEGLTEEEIQEYWINSVSNGRVSKELVWYYYAPPVTTTFTYSNYTANPYTATELLSYNHDIATLLYDEIIAGAEARNLGGLVYNSRANAQVYRFFSGEYLFDNGDDFLLFNGINSNNNYLCNLMYEIGSTRVCDISEHYISPNVSSQTPCFYCSNNLLRALMTDYKDVMFEYFGITGEEGILNTYRSFATGIKGIWINHLFSVAHSIGRSEGRSIIGEEYLDTATRLSIGNDAVNFGLYYATDSNGSYNPFYDSLVWEGGGHSTSGFSNETSSVGLFAGGINFAPTYSFNGAWCAAFVTYLGLTCGYELMDFEYYENGDILSYYNLTNSEQRRYLSLSEINSADYPIETFDRNGDGLILEGEAYTSEAVSYMHDSSMVNDHLAYFINQGRIVPTNLQTGNAVSIPAQAGDIIFYSWEEDRRRNDRNDLAEMGWYNSEHIGVVLAFDDSDGYVYVLEGNMSDSVGIRRIHYTSDSIIAYGRMF